MTHILASMQDNADRMYFEHLQEVVTMATPHVAFALGTDEAKRFEADVSKCINGNGDVFSRCRRLEVIYRTITTRILAYLEEQAEVTRRLKQQLQAYVGFNVEHVGIWSTENLREDANQNALVLAQMLNAQYARQLQASSNHLEVFTHHAKFSEQERTTHESAMQKLAALADSTKASMDAANEASARLESALLALLEKDASETSERIAQVVRDVQKVAYEKDDPDRPACSKIQQQPLHCLERTVQALKRASEGKGRDGDATKCADCQALKAKLDALEKTLETLQKENGKLLDDKKDLLQDRQRDKDDMNKLIEQLAKLRAEKSTENTKKRSK